MKLVERWGQIRRMQAGGLVAAAPILPMAGSFYDQPAAVIDAFELFDQWLAEGRKDRTDA